LWLDGVVEGEESDAGATLHVAAVELLVQLPQAIVVLLLGVGRLPELLVDAGQVGDELFASGGRELCGKTCREPRFGDDGEELTCILAREWR
jgi:hypothetical protein